VFLFTSLVSCENNVWLLHCATIAYHESSRLNAANYSSCVHYVASGKKWQQDYKWRLRKEAAVRRHSPARTEEELGKPVRIVGAAAEPESSH